MAYNAGGTPREGARPRQSPPDTMTSHRLLSPRDFRRMPWKNGGGRTAEIAAWAGEHGAGAFAGRVSIAEIDRDGPFSTFPGIDRTFVLLDGAGVVLTQGGVDVEVTARHEPVRFAGDEASSCRLVAGPARAFNLMVRRGRAQGGVVVADGVTAVAGPFRFGVCYAAEGASECLLPGRAPIAVAEGHALLVEGEDRMASMHVNPIDAGAVAIVAALDAAA